MTTREPDHIDQFPISEDSIRNRVCEIGRQIIEDLQRDAGPDGTIDLTVMPVLSGAFMFTADLVRHFHTVGGLHPHKLVCPIEPLIARSYGEKIVADGAQVTAEKMPDVDIEVVTYVLAKLPERGLLQSRFDGDVRSLLSYIEARHGARALDRARRP